MLRNFLKNRKAQNTAEYALLIALVVAGIIAMQTYAQRALQARVHDVSQYMANATGTIGTSKQYEPYYMQSDYNSTRTGSDTTYMDNSTVGYNSQTNTARAGEQQSTYSNSDINQTL
jgi:Flp pilus assembly pilin Flp